MATQEQIAALEQAYEAAKQSNSPFAPGNGPATEAAERAAFAAFDAAYGSNKKAGTPVPDTPVKQNTDTKASPEDTSNSTNTKEIQGQPANNEVSDDNSKPVEGYTSDGGYAVNMSGTTGQKQDVPNSSNKAQTDQQYPGARKTNPLSNYSSYAYVLQLYMVTPEVLNTLANNKGVLPTDATSKTQTVLVAQSGGINNSVDNRALPYSRRIGQPNQSGFDYYIDDLMINSAVAPDAPPSTYTFKITEPLGYTLLTRLMETSKALNKLSNVAGMIDGPPLSIQNYILGIKFVGYDASGNIVNSGSGATSSGNVNSDTTTTITPRYFPIRIEKMVFKLTGQSTVYDVTAIPYPEQAGLSSKNGILNLQGEISSPKGKVGEALQGLMDKLNKYQESQIKVSQTKVTTYSIKYLPGAEEIRDASLLDNTQVESMLTSMSQAVKTTIQSNIKAGVAAVSNLVTSRTTSLTAGTPVLTGIDIIISKSDYIGKALSKINTSEAETRTEAGQQSVALKWYSCNLVATINGYDKATNTYTYDIVYEIGTYPVAYIRTPMTVTKSKYPGPYKLYNYLLTGENTEVLDYELTFDNLYAIINTARTDTGSTDISATKLAGEGASIVPAPAVKSNPIGGKQNAGSYQQDSIKAQMNLDGNNDAVSVKIKIMGDPDWLMTQVGNFQSPFDKSTAGTASQTTLDTVKNAYGDNYSINPFSGQVFCQIIFYMAEDYNDLSYNNKATDGLLDVSDSINFFDTTERRDSGIKGIVYRAWAVTSNFNNGVFTQVLEANLAPKGLLEGTITDTVSNERENTSSTPAKDTRTTVSNSQALSQVNASRPTNYGDETYPTIDPEVKRVEQAAQEDKNINAANVGRLSQPGAEQLFGEDSVRSGGSTPAGAALRNPGRRRQR